MTMPLRDRQALGVAARLAARDTRLNRYAELHAAGVDDEEAADQLGVSLRTAQRYRQQLNQQGTTR